MGKSLFWTQYTAESLGLFLSRAKGAGDLDHHIGIRQVYCKISHFGDNQDLDRPFPEILI